MTEFERDKAEYGVVDAILWRWVWRFFVPTLAILVTVYVLMGIVHAVVTAVGWRE